MSPSDSQSESPRGVMRRIRPRGEMPYPFTYQAINVRNEEMPPYAQNSLESLDEAVSLSHTEAMIFTSSSSHDLIADTDSKEGDTGRNRVEGEMTYRERSVGTEQVAAGSKQAEILADIVVINSEEDEEEMKGNSRQNNKQGMERTRFPLKEVASEAIREMQEFDRKQKGKSIKNPEGPALETQDDAEAGDEEVTVPAKWK